MVRDSEDRHRSHRKFEFLSKFTNFLKGRNSSSSSNSKFYNGTNKCSKSKSMVDAIPSDFAYFDASPSNFARPLGTRRRMPPISECDVYSTASLPENLKLKVNNHRESPQRSKIIEKYISNNIEQAMKLKNVKQRLDVLNNRSQRLFISQLDVAGINCPGNHNHRLPDIAQMCENASYDVILDRGLLDFEDFGVDNLKNDFEFNERPENIVHELPRSRDSTVRFLHAESVLSALILFNLMSYD